MTDTTSQYLSADSVQASILAILTDSYEFSPDFAPTHTTRLADIAPYFDYFDFLELLICTEIAWNFQFPACAVSSLPWYVMTVQDFTDLTMQHLTKEQQQ